MQTASRITVPVAIVSLLLLVVGVSGAWYVHRLQIRTSKILDVNVDSIVAAEELALLFRQMRTDLNRYLLSGDDVHLKNAAGHQHDVQPLLDIAEQNATTPLEQMAIAEIHKALGPFFEELSLIVQDSQNPGTREQVNSLVANISAAVIANAETYLDFNENQLTEANAWNQSVSSRLAIALLLLGTCGSVSGLVAGYGVARGVSRSIFQLSVPIRDVAGKLNEVVGPISVSADPGLDDLETVLQKVSGEVESVIEKLHQSHREIVRADQLAAMGQLAAGLAHELRNPLMCMKVLVQSARRGNNEGLDGRDLEVLDEEIARLEDRLEDFLDFARPTRLKKKEFDLRQAVSQTVHLLAPRAHRRQIMITPDQPEDPLIIEADEGQIRQVVLNLLLNALDAVATGGRIRVRTSMQNDFPADDGLQQINHAVLEVVDDGRGLPVNQVDRIFEPFFSTNSTGLGLGLAICRRIVESHGGGILAASGPSGGTVFTVQLPAASSNTSLTLPAAASRAPAT